MSLINTDDAIDGIEEQMNDLKELICMYEDLLIKLNKVNEYKKTRQTLHDAGFTDEQINTFVEIVMRTKEE